MLNHSQSNTQKLRFGRADVCRARLEPEKKKYSQQEKGQDLITLKFHQLCRAHFLNCWHIQLHMILKTACAKCFLCAFRLQCPVTPMERTVSSSILRTSSKSGERWKRIWIKGPSKPGCPSEDTWINMPPEWRGSLANPTSGHRCNVEAGLQARSWIRQISISIPVGKSWDLLSHFSMILYNSCVRVHKPSWVGCGSGRWWSNVHERLPKGSSYCCSSSWEQHWNLRAWAVEQVCVISLFNVAGWALCIPMPIYCP